MLNESNLHDYQRRGVQHILDKSHAGLFLEMGLGKTVTTLTAINKLLYEELEIDNCLITAPKRVVESVWHKEIEKWEHLRHLTISRIIGTERQRKHALKKKADIHIISRDNLPWLIGLYGGTSLPYDMLVIDESSSYKNHASIRFKTLRKVQPSFQRVVILTGTPAPNGYVDLWSQIWLLDRGERLGKFISLYREKYFTSKGYYGNSYKIRKGAEKAIFRKISDLVISMKSKDYITLPEKVDNFIEVDFDLKLADRYKRFEYEQVIKLINEAGEDEEIFAANAAALMNKLLQFSNGFMYNEDSEPVEIHKLKITELKEIVEQAGGNPVLVAWIYRNDRDRIMKALEKYEPVNLKGEKEVDDWNEGKIKVLLMHPASGGHGLNLQAGGNIVVWFGLPWSLELYQQLNARLHRQGQEKGVIVHHIVNPATADKAVVEALTNKKNKQEALMDAVKARIEKYSSNYV